MNEASKPEGYSNVFDYQNRKGKKEPEAYSLNAPLPAKDVKDPFGMSPGKFQNSPGRDFHNSSAIGQPQIAPGIPKSEGRFVYPGGKQKPLSFKNDTNSTENFPLGYVPGDFPHNLANETKPRVRLSSKIQEDNINAPHID